MNKPTIELSALQSDILDMVMKVCPNPKLAYDIMDVVMKSNIPSEAHKNAYKNLEN